MSLTEKQKDSLRKVFKINNDQKETNQEKLIVENQPEAEPETKTAKKGNMKRTSK